MSLKERINHELKESMRQANHKRRDALRLIMAAIKQIEVDERIQVDDARLLAILDKMVKQRRDSISQYQVANRQDLIDQEQYEINLIQEFLPSQLTDPEIDQIITEAIEEVGGAQMQNMGKIMAIVKHKVQGRADVGAVSNKVKSKLK